MDKLEARRTEERIRGEAVSVALALADHPEFAIDIRDTLGEVVGDAATRQDLDDLYPIGGAEDMQSDPDSTEYRRTRRLAELKLALDEAHGPRWPQPPTA